MSKFLQKKIIIADEKKILASLKIKSMFENKNLVKNPNINNYKNLSLEVVHIDNVNKKTFMNLLDDLYLKLINGGILIINLDKIKIPEIELLGRFMYKGFEYHSKEDLDNSEFLSVVKKYEKSKIKSPSIKPIISLDRVGFKGENIKIHKIRSMYKYSEFLHQGMLENSGLSTIGKVKSDPRITSFGKFMRKYWIDELPQFYDLITFKIKIVGIRAMSYAFFEQYPERYKKKYYKVKPGLIGPIFDDKTTDFDNIVKTEEKYLDDYLKNPYKTDFKLFFKTLFMIFKGSRSS